MAEGPQYADAQPIAASPMTGGRRKRQVVMTSEVSLESFDAQFSKTTWLDILIPNNGVPTCILVYSSLS